jgi:hypothetical protein
MEINELISPPEEHSVGSNDDCPFCPIEKGKKYRTFKGVDNNSKILEEIMTNPACLTGKQEGAWPHAGKEPPSGKKPPSRKDKESEHCHKEYGYYEFQAHHLISGKQALKGHEFEQWIAADVGTIEEDTGYSINGSLNGLWAPSWPKSFRKGKNAVKWTSADLDREKIANFVMKKEGCQFHLGAHNIGDPEDPENGEHERYDEWLKSWLSKMNSRMWGWTIKCPLCIEKGKPKKQLLQPNALVNQYLNNLSDAARDQLTAPPKDWFIFLSRLALKYHRSEAHSIAECEALK